MQHVITPSKSTRTLFVFIISLILLSTLIEAAPARSNGVSGERLDELVKFANFASAAYCEPSSFRSGKCGPICDATKGTKVEKSITTRKTGTQVFIATHEEDELIIVSYRGTVRENIANIITDAKIILSDYPPVEGAQVHLGFYEAFLEVQSEVFDVVQRLHRKNPTYKVVYTGHSLGGALTLLSALDLVQNSNDFVKNENLFVFTYGEPRVGNSEFAKHVDSKLKVFRTVNGPDSVSRLPPRFLGYRHHSGELWISNPERSSFDAVECNGPEDINCSLSLPITELSLRLHSGPFYGVSMRACRLRNKSFKPSEADQTDLEAFENLGGKLKEPKN